MKNDVTRNYSQDNFTFCYYDRDHLGNVRQVREANGGSDGRVIQTLNYYPFGAQLCDGTTDSNVQNHKYNGKEFDGMHGLNTYDYGARQYNPVTARWDRVDPLCEKDPGISPYAYVRDNPMKYIDPDGMWSWDINGNLVANKGDDANSMAKYLGTSSSNALQILNRCGVKANSRGLLDLSAGQILYKSNLWVGSKSKNGPVVNNTVEATAHYFFGNGKSRRCWGSINKRTSFF